MTAHRMLHMEDFNLPSVAGHSFSGLAILGSLVGWFPPIAVLLAIVWYVIQIYESNTVQKWRQARRVKKIATLKIEMARLEALELLQQRKDDE